MAKYRIENQTQGTVFDFIELTGPIDLTQFGTNLDTFVVHKYAYTLSQPFSVTLRGTVAPFVIQPPVLSGSPVVGQVISLDPGNYGGTLPLNLDLRYRLDGVIYPNASGQSFTLPVTEVGKSLSAEVVVTNDSGGIIVASNTIGPITASVSGTGLTATPTTSGVFTAGQVVYAVATPTDQVAPDVQYRWKLNGVVQFGEQSRAYACGTPAIGATLQPSVRVWDANGLHDWVDGPLLTCQALIPLTTREFGALTYAGHGGFPLPAGASTITNAGGTNLTVVAGEVVPASNGVTSGTVTFNNAATVTITAIPNARSVNTIGQLRTAMQASDLTRGTSRILLRGGVDYNTAKARVDVQLPVGGIAGTIDVGYVDVTGHSNELRANICSLGFQPVAAGGVRNEFAFDIHHINYLPSMTSNADAADSAVMKSSIVNRSTSDPTNAVNGLRIRDCYFGTIGTDAAPDYGRRLTGIGSSNHGYYWTIKDNIFDRVAYAANKVVQSVFEGNEVARFSLDAFIANGNGNVVRWNRAQQPQTDCEEFLNPPIVTRTATTTTFSIPSSNMFNISADSVRNDGAFYIMEADGDLAPYVGSALQINAGASVFQGTEITLPLAIPGIDLGTVSHLLLRRIAWHGDFYQTTAVGFKDSRAAINALYPGYDFALLGNALGHGDSPAFGGIQFLFLENGSPDAARVLIAGNIGIGVYAHGAKAPNQGSAVMVYNTIAPLRYPNSVAGIGSGQGDQSRALTEPERCLAHGNVAQSISFWGNGNQVQQSDNIIPASDGSDRTAIFRDPQVIPANNIYPSNFITPLGNYSVLPEVGAAHYGAAGNPLVSFTNRTIVFDPIAYGMRIVQAGDGSAVPYTYTVEGDCLTSGDTVYWAVTDQTGATPTVAQIKAGSGAGIIRHGTIASASSETRWSAAIAPINGGSYRVWAVAERAANAYSKAFSSPISVVVTALYPEIALVSVNRTGVNGTSTRELTHAGVPISAAPTTLVAFEVFRGIGAPQVAAIGGDAPTEIAAPQTIWSAGRAVAYELPNFGDRTATSVFLSGGTPSSTARGTLALISGSAMGSYELTTVSPANGATAASTTLDVKTGDRIYAILDRTTADFGAVTWTGLTEVSPSTQIGDVASWSAVASATIAADNAAYPVGAAWVAGGNNQALCLFRIRKKAAAVIVTPPPVAAPIDLFIVAGQSNAVGRAPDDLGTYFPTGTIEYGATNAWTTVDKRLYHGPWEAATATDANFGFARQFARDYQAANPAAQLGFIGVAKGGTGFANGNWNKGNPEYAQAIARINAALAAAPAGSVLKGILWHQGENDGQTIGAQNAYAAALTQFIADFRGDITGGANVPFVLGGHAYGAQYYNHVTHRAIQAIPNTILRTGYAPADVSRNATLADAVHFDAASQRRLGAQFVTALAEATANTALGGAGSITTGTLARGILGGSVANTHTVASVPLGAAAADRMIVVGVQGRSSSSPYPTGATIAGIPMKRFASPTAGTGFNSVTMFYAMVPAGTTGDLVVNWSGTINAGQNGYFALPVYGARPHLARQGAFDLQAGSNSFGTSITANLTVAAGDLVIAILAGQQTTVPVGALNLGVSDNAALGANCCMTVGYEIAASAGAKAVTGTWGGVTINNPGLIALALKAA